MKTSCSNFLYEITLLHISHNNEGVCNSGNSGGNVRDSGGNVRNRGEIEYVLGNLRVDIVIKNSQITSEDTYNNM